MIGKVFKKLSANDIDIVNSFFICEYADIHDAMSKCNRLFLDKIDKPKNWKFISEVICCIITHHYLPPKP